MFLGYVHLYLIKNKVPLTPFDLRAVCLVDNCEQHYSPRRPSTTNLRPAALRRSWQLPSWAALNISPSSQETSPRLQTLGGSSKPTTGAQRKLWVSHGHTEAGLWALLQKTATPGASPPYCKVTLLVTTLDGLQTMSPATAQEAITLFCLASHG